MESLELGDSTNDASDVKAEVAASVSSRRRRRRSWLTMGTVALFAVSAMIYFMVGFHQMTNQEKTSSSSSSEQPQVADANNSPSSSSSSSSSWPICDDLYECQTDRMGHETPLYAGQSLCNDKYRFGVTRFGVFQWHDCEAQVTKVIYDPTTTTTATTTTTTVSYFSMSPQGAFRLMDDQDQIIWQKESKMTITPTKECLPRPLLDCPYLHLRKSAGDVVLNSINSGSWSARKIERVFDDLYH